MSFEKNLRIILGISPNIDFLVNELDFCSDEVLVIEQYALSISDRVEHSDLFSQTMGEEMKIRIGKPAVNNFKTYGW